MLTENIQTERCFFWGFYFIITFKQSLLHYTIKSITKIQNYIFFVSIIYIFA